MDSETLETTIRQFLEEFGVSGHQVAGVGITAAVVDGRVIEGQAIAVSATLTIDAIGLNHTVDGVLNTTLN